jgi:hypothetical protein
MAQQIFKAVEDLTSFCVRDPADLPDLLDTLFSGRAAVFRAASLR